MKVAKLPGQRCAVLRLRAADADLLARANGALGALLPLDANRANGDLLWLAPGEWLLVDCSEEVLKRLGDALDRATFHIADITHGRMALSLTGAPARALLARGCSLDLHPRAFPHGSCAQSVFAQIPAIIHFRSDTPEYRLYLDSSFEAYAMAWLCRAAAFFPGIELP